MASTSGLTINGRVPAASVQDEKDHLPSTTTQNLSLSSKAIHADDFLNDHKDVAPPLHVSTTFRYPSDPSKLYPVADITVDGHVYSRETAPNTTRLEAILSSVFQGPSVTYSSGLSAFYSLIVLLNPKSIAIGEGYHGCHHVIKTHQKLTGLKQLDLDCPAEDLQPGDIVHVETPLNPTGAARNLEYYAKKAHSRGAFLTVDATFGPPPLQNPFLHGADVILHSGTKYVGGHSDLLCGILSVRGDEQGLKWLEILKRDRTAMGNVMGNHEAWLGIRSIRTLGLRVERASSNTRNLVEWLVSALNSDSKETLAVRACVSKLDHASQQKQDIADGWLAKQMPNGFGPVFALTMKQEQYAKALPSKLKLFHHATSLGGVESLIEWRSMSDATVDRKLLRVSVGIEGWEDLRDDLLQAFEKLSSDFK